MGTTSPKTRLKTLSLSSSFLSSSLKEKSEELLPFKGEQCSSPGHWELLGTTGNLGTTSRLK
jgi:hypothetical protein